jgi:hypothetical protein
LPPFVNVPQRWVAGEAGWRAWVLVDATDEDLRTLLDAYASLAPTVAESAPSSSSREAEERLRDLIAHGKTVWRRRHHKPTQGALAAELGMPRERLNTELKTREQHDPRFEWNHLLDLIKQEMDREGHPPPA